MKRRQNSHLHELPGGNLRDVPPSTSETRGICASFAGTGANIKHDTDRVGDVLLCGVLRPVGETEVVLMHSIRPVNARIGARSSYPPNLCPGSEKRVLNSHNNQCIVFVKSVPEADLGWLVDAAASRSQTSGCIQPEL